MNKVMIITNHSYMLWRFRKELIVELSKTFEVVLVMPFVGHEDDFSNLGFKCIQIDIDRRGINFVKDFKLYRELKKIVRTEKPSKIITYSVKPNIYGGLVARKYKIPYFVNVQGLGTAFQRKFLSIVVTFLYKLSLKRVQKVFFENDTNRLIFCNKKIISEDKTVVLNGAGINLNDYPIKPYPNNSCFTFLYLGRIMKEKGISELFEACEKLKSEGYKFVLNLVGFFEDEYKDSVERLSKNGIVNYLGFQSNPLPYYESCDCVVLPSYHEGMSNVLLEASAIGCPSITTDIPGCKESIIDSFNGFICKKQDVNSLIECMKKVMSLNIAERAKMGVNGHDFMSQCFNKEKIVAETIEIVGD